MRWRLPRLARSGLAQAGWPAVAGATLLAFSLAFHFSAIEPARAKLAELRQETESLKALAVRTAKADEPAKSPASQLTAFYRFFPAAVSTPDWLEKIYQAAQSQNLALEHGEYRPQREKWGKLTRYRILLPVRGSYVQIRKFLVAVMAEVPIASLDGVSFERQKIGESTVEAKIRLTLYLEEGQ